MIKKRWRWIPLEEPRDARWNMAADEFLFENRGSWEAILRFYRWHPAALSVGYFQKLDELTADDLSEKGVVSAVRRITGGGRVYHGRDLTLSLVVAEKNPYFAERASQSYADIHQVLVEGLKAERPRAELWNSNRNQKPRSSRVCFEEPVNADVMEGGRKLIGSSQRRGGKNLLHQTSIQEVRDPALLQSAILQSFTEKLGIDFESKPFSAEEKRLIADRAETKYRQSEFSRDI